MPTIRVARGALLRLRFGFLPTSVSLGVGGRQLQLTPRRITTWRVTRTGTLFVFATAKQGDTSYIGCVRLKS